MGYCRTSRGVLTSRRLVTAEEREETMKKFFFGSSKEGKDEEKSKPSTGESSVFLTGSEQVDPAKIKLLLDTMAEVISSIEPDRLLLSIVDRCIELVHAERGILFLKDRNGNPSVKVARNSSGKTLDRNIQFSTKVVSDVFTTGSPVLLKVGATEPTDLSKSVVDLKLRAVMCVTLSVKQQTIGVIYVDSRITSREFKRSDLKFFDALANALAITIENARLVLEHVKAERLKESLDIARRIQSDLIPRDPGEVNGFDLAGRLDPLEVTAGDYYDFIEIGDDKIGVVVGDVTGHGVGPAILMSSVRSLTRALMHREFSIDAALSFLNNQLEQDTDEGIFVSFFLGVLDFGRKRLSYGNAGHCPPLLLRGATGEFEELKRTGMALGVMADAPYAPPVSIDLNPGDILALYTDGIPEAQCGDKLFGFDRFRALLRENAGMTSAGIIDTVFGSVREYIGDGATGDDLTLSIVKVS
jgi:serine phosphatase RsbU (regulator of sigma subunit)